jgi:phosphonate transport system substrate-binding protein
MFIRLLVFLTLLVVGGCSDHSDTRTVDFSRTVAAARPAADPTAQPPPLRVAVAAMVSPRETFVHYREILDYIGTKLGKEVHLIQRKTYSEINDLLGKGEIDLAFICSGPYAANKKELGFELLAAPEVHGSHFYQGYLIVNEKSPFRRLEDLRGKSFAFTDPDSNTGRLVPVHWLAEMHEWPETFFSHTMYTYSHDNSILAVAKGMVDGASVDGLVWDYYQAKEPSLTSRTRIIRKSDQYGIPPLVASKHLSPELREQIGSLFFSMHEDAYARQILSHLMIDRFVKPEDAWYEGIRQLFSGQEQSTRQNHEIPKP